MLTLRKSEIPEYLKQGELYKTLIENNDDPNEEVTFPADVLKLDTTVQSLLNCDHLLKTVRFWVVNGFVSKELIDFALFSCPDEPSILKVLQKYETEFKWIYYLTQIVKAYTFDKLKVAIKSGMIELLQPLVKFSRVFPRNACDLAAEVGNLDVFACLFNHGCTWNYDTEVSAARWGHSTILQFLVDHEYKVRDSDFTAAIQSGSLECVKCCVSQSEPQSWLFKFTKEAARHGHLSILQFLHEVGYGWNCNATQLAAQYGHMHCLQYLHENGCPWDTEHICEYAASAGHVDCLQYAHQHGCVFQSVIVAHAAVEGGHVGCLHYAHAHGCTWWINCNKYGAYINYEDGDSCKHSVSVKQSNPCSDYLYQHAHCFK